MASYRLSRLAEADLREISAATITNWGSIQARAYLESLDKTMLALADNPNLGRERAEIYGGARSFPCGKHIIFYRTAAKDIIEIARVLHQRMDVLGQFNDEF
ncbi:MAG TPA: type II toxin-antitoxin system RelE/ParE family toxin [Rheinheimera sp.]|uniref:type II toxin-antitoxin system RelE/ParE family toxin n=1 Tax=Rheinheimera sp. TaxID=1869214 RepID=UPI000ED8BC51|nr:type II toxin-antitoxin system RelE/ParE family toxin [Rheinheimera sp.]HCU67622.1 type II toxin-antitoxin system RelE/ParE family toxin [Rheinheimera sp.]